MLCTSWRPEVHNLVNYLFKTRITARVYILDFNYYLYRKCTYCVCVVVQRGGATWWCNVVVQRNVGNSGAMRNLHNFRGFSFMSNILN